MGIFEPQGGPRPAAWGADIARTNRVRQDDGPAVSLASTIAENLERGDIVVIREAEYKVLRIAPDGTGLRSRCELVAYANAGLGTSTT
jgi:hypothetical protein